jgi:hypothetical protein
VLRNKSDGFATQSAILAALHQVWKACLAASLAIVAEKIIEKIGR